MATLVLTAVGTALGGPLGGALGAILGQSADAILFAPKARQGPRLSDLKVQTSSYGDAIPRLYGTMRVAGTVIWATDLIERRQSRSAGKGRPKSVEFTYSASFAVALSARRIGAILRIWADGRLLRDATGRFAESVSFRSYSGDSDQPVDPLIASAVGTDQASGFRGIAYAMFEALDLSAFGNRIPQLSFEIEADAGPVAPALIGADLLAIAVAAGGPVVTGYAAGGGQVRDALAPLAAFAELGLWVSGTRVALAPPDWPGDGVVDGSFARVHAEAPLRAEEDRRTPLARVPRQIVLRHFDPGRDYQTSQQSGDVAGGGGAARVIEMPAAVSPSAAQAQTKALAQSVGDARRAVQVRAGLGALALPLGQGLVLDVADMAEQRWRIAERRIDGDGVALTLLRHEARLGAVPLAGDGGIALVAPDLPRTDATLYVFDVPGDGDTPRTVPLRLIAAAGGAPDWRGADLWWVGSSATEPEPIGRLNSAAVLGVSDHPLAAAETWLIDWKNTLDVTLVHSGMSLNNISNAALVDGGNLAMIGNEAIQFSRATPLGAQRWRLEGLLRARGGTRAPDGGHGVGAPFTLLGDAALLQLPDVMAMAVASYPAAVDWLPRGGSVIARAEVPAGQRALLPLSPVHGRAERGPGGAAMIHWIPRSRAGGRWRDGVDAPIGEAMPLWQLRWTDPSLAIRNRHVAAASAELEAGSYAPGTAVTVVQQGDFGLSDTLTILLPV